MRQILAVLSAVNHPVTIVAKSALILRDPGRRSDPGDGRALIPALTDHELDSILSAAAEQGATEAS